MITTCKRFESGNELYARFHTSNEEVVRGKRYAPGTVECTFTIPPSYADKKAAKAWVNAQIEATNILVKYPHLQGKVTFVWQGEK